MGEIVGICQCGGAVSAAVMAQFERQISSRNRSLRETLFPLAGPPCCRRNIMATRQSAGPPALLLPNCRRHQESWQEGVRVSVEDQKKNLKNFGCHSLAYAPRRDLLCRAAESRALWPSRCFYNASFRVPMPFSLCPWMQQRRALVGVAGMPTSHRERPIAVAGPPPTQASPTLTQLTSFASDLAGIDC